MNKSVALHCPRIVDSGIDRTSGGARLAFDLVAVRENARQAIATHDFMAQISCDAFGAVAPEDDALLQVDHADAGGQAFDNAPANFPVLKFLHADKSASS